MLNSTAWKKHLGVIDLGSNSVRLIVVQYTPGQSFKVTEEFSRRVRLAEGMTVDNRLRPAAMARAIATLRMFCAFCEANGVTRVLAVATAAVRDAANQREFVARVRAATGLRLRVLSGEAEAHFGALGVINSLGLRHALVMDVGGGSTEVSLVRQGRFAHGVTTPLGAVRLTDLYLPGERARARDVERLERHVDETFARLAWMELKAGSRLVGLGGTLRALARIDRDARDYPLRLLNGYQLDRDRLERLIERMIALPVEKRPRKITGLQADRADVILAGALVVARAMRRARADSLLVCDQGLREGLFYREFLGRAAPPLIPDLRRFSVLNLGRVYGYQTDHADQVARLAVSLFDQLQRWHGGGPAEREYLWAAAQLDDIGTAVNYQDHHRHSAYLILSAGLPGYSHRETTLIAMLCMYHHKGKAPLKPYRPVLNRSDATRIAQLGAILRTAEDLDASRTRSVADVRVRTRGRRIMLTAIPRRGRDIRWELAEAARVTHRLEEAFDCTCEILVG